MQTKRIAFASVQPLAGLRNPSRRRPLPGAFLTAGAFALCLAAAAPAHAQFTVIDPPGTVDATAAGINSHGAVIGSYTQSTGGPHGFLRTVQGDFTTFDAPGSIETEPVAINTAGTIAGYYFDSTSGPHGFVRDVQGDVTSFDPKGSTLTVPTGINTDGTITGIYVSNNLDHGFIRKSNGDITSFDVPHDFNTSPVSINGAGIVIGSSQRVNTSNSFGFLRQADGQFINLGLSRFPAAINNHSVIVGTYSSQAFVRSAAGHITLFNVPGSSQTFAALINSAGTIVGGYTDSIFQQHGFLRDAKGNITSFDPLGSLLTQPTGINGSGVICGYYSDAAGSKHAFIFQ